MFYVRTALPFALALFLSGCSASGPPPAPQAAAPSQADYPFDLRQIAGQNPSATFAETSPLGKPALRFRAGQGSLPLHLPGPRDGVAWDQARYLVAEVWHDDPHSDILTVHFFGADPETPRIASKMGVLPGLPTQLVVPLAYLDGQTFFMERRPRLLKGSMPGRRLDPGRLTAVTLGLTPVAPGFAPEVWIADLHLTAAPPAPLPDAAPIVDALGQWSTRTWPGKTPDEATLIEGLQALHAAADTAAFPASWSRYGGWKAKRFDATGFFRTEHDGTRWWLVDPDGYAFLSVGVDVMAPYAAGPVDGMGDLFAWLPDPDGPFAAAYGDGGRSFSFLTANLIRAFGADWQARWEALTRGLMRQARFNTVGNWSDVGFARRMHLPYVLPLADFPTTDVLLYRDFPDVFDPAYAAAAADYARQLTAYRDDPYLIGYFLRNEPLWAFGDNILAAEMLATDTPSFTRRALVAWLRDRYGDDATALSAAWEHALDRFESLETMALPEAAALSAQAEADLRAFSELMVDEYLRHPSEKLRAVDPHHLNLGIRYAWISSELCYRGAAYFDVFSINAYAEKPDAAVVSEITARTGRPVFIGEFHHGAIDRGLPSTGIYGVASQADRGTAYRYYVEQGARLPGLVGMHYFQLNDQPILGRFDGENYNIGLVDVCNRPYPELMAAAAQSNARIYEVAAGRVEAFSPRAEAIPKIFF